MSDLKQYMINRRDALLEINEFNMANEFEIMLEDFAEQLSIPSSAEERYREALEEARRLLDWPNSIAHVKSLINETLSNIEVPFEKNEEMIMRAARKIGILKEDGE